MWKVPAPRIVKLNFGCPFAHISRDGKLAAERQQWPDAEGATDLSLVQGRVDPKNLSWKNGLGRTVRCGESVEVTKVIRDTRCDGSGLYRLKQLLLSWSMKPWWSCGREAWVATVRGSGGSSAIEDISLEPSGSTVCGSGHILCDSNGKELRRVGDVPRSLRERWDLLANRKDMEPNCRLEVRREVGEVPTPTVATPRDQIFIGKKVTRPMIFVLSLGTAKAVLEVAC